MFKFNPHFEMYRIIVSVSGDVKEPFTEFFGWWYFTKHVAERKAEMLNTVRNHNDCFIVERAIRSDRVRERISQKA
jgi:hypothetical protein